MKKYWKILAGLAVAGALAALYVFVFVVNKSHPDYEKARADFSVEARSIFDAYRADAAKASKTYDGKILEISGVLSGVESSGAEVIAFFVLEEGMFGPEGIRVRMLQNQHLASQALSAGNLVKLKGYVTGYNETDVLLEHGSIVQ